MSRAHDIICLREAVLMMSFVHTVHGSRFTRPSGSMPMPFVLGWWTLTGCYLRNFLPSACGLHSIGSSTSIITLVLMMPRGISEWRANIRLPEPLSEPSRSGKIGSGADTAHGDCFSRARVRLTVDPSLPTRSYSLSFVLAEDES